MIQIYLIGYVIVFLILTLECLIKKNLNLANIIINIYIASMSWLMIIFFISNKYEKLFK